MSASIDQQFVEFVVKSLVSKPDAVSVERRIDEKGVLLELTVDPEDLGRVIGKRGATAQSLRTLLRALGTKNDARYNLKIVDNGEGGHMRREDNRPERRDEGTHEDSGNQPKPAPAKSSDDDDELDDEMSASQASSEGSDRLAKTRKELADLDDLDL